MAHPSPVRAALPLWGLALVLLVAVAAVLVAMQWSTATDQQAAVLGDEAALFLAGVESGAPSLGDMAERYFEGPGSDSTFAHTPSLSRCPMIRTWWRSTRHATAAPTSPS